MSRVPEGWAVVDLSTKREHLVDAGALKARAAQGATRNQLCEEFQTSAAIVKELAPWLRGAGLAASAKTAKVPWWHWRRPRAPGRELSLEKIRALCRQNLIRYELVPRLAYLAVKMPQDINRRKVAARLRRDFIRDLYKEGAPTREIYCRTGVSPSQISAWTFGLQRRSGKHKSFRLVDAIFTRIPVPKVPTSGEQALEAPRAGRIPDSTREMARDMYRRGLQMHAIAAACKVSLTSVKNHTSDLPRRD